MSDAQTPGISNRASSTRLRVGLGAMLAIVFLAMVLPVIEWAPRTGDYAFDEQTFHLPTVRLIATKWPSLDVRNDPQSAISPGYHYFLAGIARLFSMSDHGLVLVNAMLSLVIVLVVFAVVSGCVNAWSALLLVLPFLFSGYYLKASCFVGTDNAALLFIVLSISAIVFFRATTGSNIAAGIFACLATAIRQNSAWLIAPMFVRTGHGISDRSLDAQPLSRGRAIISTLIAVLPTIALVLFLIWRWGGLTPPAFQEVHTGASILPLVIVLSLFGMFGVFFLPLLSTKFILDSLKDRAFITGAVLSALIALIPASSYNAGQERWGGVLWSVVQHLPTIANRSIIFPPLAIAGFAVLFLAYRNARSVGSGRDAFILYSVIVMWTLSQCVNRRTFQRYYEPISLVLLAYLFTLILRRKTATRKAQFAGVVALALIQLAITAATLYGKSFAR